MHIAVCKQKWCGTKLFWETVHSLFYVVKPNFESGRNCTQQKLDYAQTAPTMATGFEALCDYGILAYSEP